MLKGSSYIVLSVLLGLNTLININVFAHDDCRNMASSNSDNANIRFSENKGQWHDNVLYKLRFNTGALFLEDNALTYNFFDGEDWEQIDNWQHGCWNDTLLLRSHVFKIHFEGANTNITTEASQTYVDYENYYLGNDPNKWTSGVKAHRKIVYKDIYPGIDYSIFGKTENIKYEFILQPGADPNNINLRFEGVENLYVSNGELHYETSVNSIKETKLYCYQTINGNEIKVPCNFKVNEDKISFDFPDGYNTNHKLIIDPVLIFSTYTGSQADNFGYTATPDNNGNFYAGGIARGANYVITPGAYQSFYAGGNAGVGFDRGFDADISITKFDSAGASLIFSTYLGGNVNDQPHSLIVNDNGELHVYGRTSSTNYPTTPNAFQTSNAGGMDVVVTKFNSTGTALLGSTYLGGSLDDATNISPNPSIQSSLKFNYADDARGEIIVDDNGNIYVASCTQSSNFPVTNGAFQNTNHGAQDACVFKFNSNLSQLIWSSYYGGSGDDAAYSINFDSQNNLYFCGGTHSSNLTTTTGVITPSFIGGRADGFITHINNNGTSILQSTYIGTPQYDQTYFVQLDGDNNVYVYGQTSGIITPSPGVYSEPNSGQFIISLTPNLSTQNFATVFGRGDGNPDISPTAFLVDNCRNIYISGWGSNVGVGSLTTNGLTVTNDAYQPFTDNNDFYFMVLDRDAQSLVYATYFGGGTSDEHVDGGTSRFDKNGIIYQAVCAGCGNNDDFPYTPGAWSQNNNSTNCNLGAAKFKFEVIGVEVDVVVYPSPTGCVPLSVIFDGIVVNAIDYLWDFGDGTTSTIENPVKTYTQTGTYTITLIGVDSVSCDNIIFSDTARATVIVDDDFLIADFIPTIISSCDSFIAQFNDTSIRAINYSWNFGDGSTSTLENPMHEYNNDGTYTVTLIVNNDTACNQYDTISKQVVFAAIIDADYYIPDTLGCIPFTADFFNASFGGQTYYWDFGNGANSTSQDANNTYTTLGTFTGYLAIYDSASCNKTDTAYFTISTINDTVKAAFDQTILVNKCDSLFVEFENLSINATSYEWFFGDGSGSTLPSPDYLFTYPDTFEVIMVAINENMCNKYDTARSTLILLPRVEALFTASDGCFPHTPNIYNQSNNAANLEWLSSLGDSSTDSIPNFLFSDIGQYVITLIATNPNTCNLRDIMVFSFGVFGYPTALFETDTNSYPIFDSILFDNISVGGVAYNWDFDDGAVSNEPNPWHKYRQEGFFEPCLIVTNEHGCEDYYCLPLEITYRGIVDLPNAFSPNGDGQNDVFYVKGYGISKMEFRIYNRWGELVFESDKLEKGWDGTYKNKDQEMEVYVYTLKAWFREGGETELLKGNITLLR